MSPRHGTASQPLGPLTSLVCLISTIPSTRMENWRSRTPYYGPVESEGKSILHYNCILPVTFSFIILSFLRSSWCFKLQVCQGSNDATSRFVLVLSCLACFFAPFPFISRSSLSAPSHQQPRSRRITHQATLLVFKESEPFTKTSSISGQLLRIRAYHFLNPNDRIPRYPHPSIFSINSLNPSGLPEPCK